MWNFFWKLVSLKLDILTFWVTREVVLQRRVAVASRFYSNLLILVSKNGTEALFYNMTWPENELNEKRGEQKREIKNSEFCLISNSE